MRCLKGETSGNNKDEDHDREVDADNVDELVALMESYKPDAVLNVALPYQDLTIMDACLKAGVNYIDTANYEPEDTDDPTWRAIYENAARKRASPHTSIIPGSGHIRRNSKRLDLWHS